MIRIIKIRDIIVVCAYIFCSSLAFSQEGVHKLIWQENGTITHEEDEEAVSYPYLRFKGMSLSDDNLPRYRQTFAVPNSDKVYTIENIVYEPIPDSLLKGVDIPRQLPATNTQLNTYGASGKYFYLDVQFLAMRLNTATNRYERVAEFTISSKDRKQASKSVEKAKSASSSLLRNGYWYKIKVKKSGIYKLSYSDITSMGISNPGSLRIFGFGGRQLSYRVSDPRPADMAEIPYYMNKGSDGVFGDGDYVLFYASGPVWWDYDKNGSMFKQYLHPYADGISYFLTSSQGAPTQMLRINNQGLSHNLTVSSYDDYDYYEEELYNLINSGRTWYSTKVDDNRFTKSFNFSNFLSGGTMKIEAKMAGRSTTTRSGTLYVNNTPVQTQSFGTISTSHSWLPFADELIFTHQFNSPSASIDVGINYGVGSISDEAYLDNFTVNARCALSYNGGAMFFRDINSVGNNNIANFQIQGATGSYQVWDITDINNIFIIDGVASGSNFSFKARTDTLREYVMLDLTHAYPKPVFSSSEPGVGEVDNQNLRGLSVNNYIIVAPDEFLYQAERLAAFHREHNNLSVLVVRPQQVYNEFSSGTPDITAMRDFFRHQYLKGSGQNCLRYVLLFGDGSYNNHMKSDGNTNYMLTYQSLNSLKPTDSYVSDDFYGLLDDGEGDYNGGLIGKLDIGIGRFPVKMVDGDDAEAEAAVDKVIRYHSAPFTDWRRKICFLGDDGYDPGGYRDDTTHMEDADSFARYIESEYPGFELKKIYLDAYTQVNSSIGQTYPQAKETLDNLFDRGILMFVYAGHGSENYLSGERMISKQSVLNMSNGDLLPLFVTATCQFSRYDHVTNAGTDASGILAETSAGEHTFLNPDGGAIALLTTTRVVYSSQNQALVLKVMANIFKRDNFGEPYRLGEIIQMAKNELTDDNKLNFTLLGDPALRLNYPQNNVITDSINHQSVNSVEDTLKAYSYVTISGYIADYDSVIMSDFNGLVYPNVYDKVQQITTFGNDNEPPFTYKDQINLIHRGKATVKDGRFTFDFIVPRDINYNIDKGKISYYAENGVVDAKGEYRDVNVGGTADEIIEDYATPRIDLYMNDTLFVDGGITNSEPYIHALLYDEHGINTTGVGIGHDIAANIDGDEENPYILNDFYEATVDDFRSGIVRYQLSEIPDGYHTLYMKVWDIFNNSTEEQLGFEVKTADGMIINKLFNYPNPATTYTKFQYTHNAADEEHQIELDVFDISGRLITRFKTSNYEAGFVSEPLEWIMTTAGNQNLMSGVYPYRLKVTTSIGTAFIDSKLIIIR